MRLRLAAPKPPPPVEHPRIDSVVDVAWDKNEKKWRGFSDDCGAFACFVSAEFVKDRFSRKYSDTAFGYYGSQPAAMTAEDRQPSNKIKTRS